MSSLLVRGQRLYAKIKSTAGRWERVMTPFTVDQRAEAERWVKDRERDVARELRRLGGIATTALTVTAYFEQWIAQRHRLAPDTNNDAGRLRKHVLPELGDMPMRDVRPKHIADLVAKLRVSPVKTPRGMEPPAGRTVHNVYSSMMAMFRDAAIEGVIEQSPCILTARQLGPKLDKDREWRGAALFTRAEVVELISSPVIPWDRRVTYALELLTGNRPGESASLRWRHYDATKTPLGSLTIANSLNSKAGIVKGTKTDAVKVVPVHPALAAILAEWKLSGWAKMVGRAPRPDDLIVPLPPEDADARTKRDGAEPFRTTYYSGRRWRERDLPALGWRARRHYDTRATFITLVLEDGADPDIIETRVTHTRRARNAFDGYDRGERWERTCAEVAKLAISRRPASALGPSVVQKSKSRPKPRSY